MRNIAVLFFLLPFAGFSQKQDGDPEKIPFKSFSLEASMLAPSQIKFPFSKIRMIDSRYDTSKLGFLPVGFFSKFKRITFKGGIAPAIEKYYADYYQHSFDSSGLELLIVMKKFWFSNVPLNKKRPGDLQQPTNSTNFYVKWEYYLGKNDNYLPIKRIDTVWTFSEELGKYIEDEFDEKKLAGVKFILKAQLEMLEYEKAVKAFAAQPGKTMAFINAYNAARFQLPVLRDNSIKNGVYLNFNEFKNNNPSISSFREKTMKYDYLKSEKYIETLNGDDIADYWGYYKDGYLRFGKRGNDRLFRAGNTFELYLKLISNTYESPASSGTPYGSASRREYFYPYQIDMETGGFY